MFTFPNVFSDLTFSDLTFYGLEERADLSIREEIEPSPLIHPKNITQAKTRILSVSSRRLTARTINASLLTAL